MAGKLLILNAQRAPYGMAFSHDAEAARESLARSKCVVTRVYIS